MLDHFDTILQSSTFRSYEKSFVERLLASLYIFVLVGIFGGVTIRLILGSLPMERFIGSLGICAIAVVGLGFLRWGKAYISALVLVVGMWIAVTVISVRGDGVFDPGFGAYTLLVFISGFLLIPRTALICAGFSVAGGLLILGSTPDMPTGSAASIWISESLYVIAAGVLVVVVSSSIRSAQERSREDREALIENNRRLEQQRIEADRLTDEVRDLNANLEKLVQDRTQALEQEMAERRRTEARYRAIVESQTDLVCRYLPDTTLTSPTKPMPHGTTGGRKKWSVSVLSI
jgi:hypothetical protein